jgi:hypothetical protein
METMTDVRRLAEKIWDGMNDDMTHDLNFIAGVLREAMEEYQARLVNEAYTRAAEVARNYYSADEVLDREKRGAAFCVADAIEKLKEDTK